MSIKYEFYYVRGDLERKLLNALSERLDELDMSNVVPLKDWFWEKKTGNQQITVYEVQTLKPINGFKLFMIGSGCKHLYINVKFLQDVQKV